MYPLQYGSEVPSKPLSQPNFRKTRIVCISDTHNQTRHLPAGDVLIHAGDLTNQGSLPELRKTVDWLGRADFEVKIVVAGNHDITLDTDFYSQYGLYFHNQEPQNVEACQNLLKNSPSITYLNHEFRRIHLTKASGPRTTFSVFGSPFSPVMASGKWAFQYEADRATRMWDVIPLDTDIVVTHTPPRNHCDSSPRGSAGCEALRKALWRTRPKLAVCGHVHEGRGVDRVRWRLDLPLCPYLEEGATLWQDPGAGTQRLSLVNLTTKGGSPLDHRNATAAPVRDNRVSFTSPQIGDVVQGPSTISTVQRPERERMRPSLITGSGSPVNAGGAEVQFSRLHTCNVEALEGRMGRKETCVINAAIMASSYGGPKTFNKPIVVDVDLPVWLESDASNPDG